MRAGAQPGRVGQREHSGGASTATRTADDLLTRGHVTVVEHRVEVATDPGGAEAQGIAQLGGGGGAVGEEQLRNPITGTAISTAHDERRGLACLGLPHLDRSGSDHSSGHRRVFHNTSVTYFGTDERKQTRR